MRMTAERGGTTVPGRMTSKLLRFAVRVGPLVVVGVLVSGFGIVGARPHAGTVHLRGTAYEFNNVHTLLSGATIRVAEFPKLRAIVQPDGRYDLRVPDHAKVTPYIVDAGYHTIYLQTFTTHGEDLANVNFQTPTEAVYRGLVALLKVPVDSQGNLVACAIVSTFSTRNVRDLSFAHFIAYGAHGVAGATATAAPALLKPVYFNEHVVPDPTQTASSKDGGVVWSNVPTGVYTITAHDPGTRFASFVATCRPGRVINANPPWGLYELALPNHTRILARWSVRGTRTQATSLSVRGLPTGAVVRLRCTGRGCPFRARTFRPGARALDIRRAIGGGKLRLTAGDALQVAVSAHAFNGLVVRWTAASGRAPTRTTLCVPLGYATPRRHCPTA
jgi:hypothetical protein